MEPDAYGAELFRIDPLTGQISPLATGVDLETMPSDYFNFTVIARDQAGSASLNNATTVIIYVNASYLGLLNLVQNVYIAFFPGYQ